MRLATLEKIIVLSVATSSVACGASPAYETKTPASVVVVPADRVVEKCPCDGEQAEAPPTTEYVHVTAWQSPPSAQRAEAFVAENPTRFRSSMPPPPALSLHSPIPETTFGRMGWVGGYRRYGR